MGLRNVCLLTLFLATFQSSMMAYPVNVGSSSSSEKVLYANEYLGYLFQKIEDSGKQPKSNGEVNLLPEETNAFANMVQCIAEEPSSGSLSTNSLRRTLKYNLIHNFISNTQKLVAFRLVIPTPFSSVPFQVNVYKPGDSDPEDSGNSRNKYIDLHVALFNQPNHFPVEEDSIYDLELGISALDKPATSEQLASILRDLKPMLVVYSYDIDIVKNLFRVPESSNVQKRSISEAVDSPSQPFAELKQEFCQVHSVNLTSFAHIVREDFKVINPAYPTATFCHGHCRTEGPEDPQNDLISQHAKFVTDTSPELVEAGISPCCIPTKYGITNYELQPLDSKNIIMIVIEDRVESCGCY